MMKKIIALSMLFAASIAMCADNKKKPKTLSKEFPGIISLATRDNQNLLKKYNIQLGIGNINWLSPRAVRILALHHTHEQREKCAPEMQDDIMLAWAKEHGANEDTIKALENALDEFFDRE